MPWRIIFCIWLSLLAAGCAAVKTPSGDLPTPTLNPAPAGSATAAGAAAACPETEAVWAKPAEDAAVQDLPAYDYYFINADQSIWASAWWWPKRAETRWKAGEAGEKVGWFRPAGADLVITGERIDAPAPPLKADVPCCYLTRFQATGLTFPAPGCWKITAKAGQSTLTVIARVAPE